MRDQHHEDQHRPPPHAPPFHHLKYKSYTLRSSEALRTPLRTYEEGRESRSPVSVGQFGRENLVGLDAVDEPPQRDVDPARHLLPLEVPDVVRDFRDDVASQLKDLVGADVGAEAADESARVLVRRVLAAEGVAEHEGCHGLGVEDG